MNIKFAYLYRDASNYKNFGHVIFPNPVYVPLEKVETGIRKYLIDGEWFYSTEWGVPDLHFDNWDPDDDHFFHEFRSVEEVSEVPTIDISIENFLKRIATSQNRFK